MIVFMSAAYARDNFFSTENIIKLRMRLIHECGLYLGFYGKPMFATLYKVLYEEEQDDLSLYNKKKTI